MIVRMYRGNGESVLERRLDRIKVDKSCSTEPTTDDHQPVLDPSRPPGFSFPINPSPGGLPAVHSRFPSGQFGTPRYCTTRSLYRGKDEVHRRARSLEHINELRAEKEIVDLKLPELLFERDEDGGGEEAVKIQKVYDFGTNYVQHYKRVLKQRGLKLEEIYKHNRNRADLAVRQDSQRSDNNKPEAAVSGNAKPESTTRSRNNRPESNALQSISTSPESSKNTSPECDVTLRVPSKYPKALPGILKENEESPIEKSPANSPEIVREDLHERDYFKRLKGNLVDLIDEYESTPGRKCKGAHASRKLGNIVSSQRLFQLLESGNPIKMENFYNYYPS